VKILLDENLPHTLRDHPAEHEVITAVFAGWSGVKNGELLRLCEDNGFDVLLTADSNLSYQQNLVERRIAIIQLTAQHWFILSAFLVEILGAIDRAAPGSFQVVECGRFER